MPHPRKSPALKKRASSDGAREASPRRSRLGAPGTRLRPGGARGGRRRAATASAPAAEKAATPARGRALSPPAGRGGTALAAAIDPFLDELARADAADTTRRAYAGDVGRFVRWLEARVSTPLTPTAVTPMDVKSYREELHRGGTGPRAINRALAALRRFFGWLEDQGAIPDSPAAGVRDLEVQAAAAPKALSNAQLNALLRAARSSGFERDRPRNYAMVQLLVNTGVRLREALELRWADVAISERAGTMRVRAGKGLKERTVPLNGTARHVLEQWRQVLGQRLGTLPERVLVGAAGEPLKARAVQYLIGEMAARGRVDGGRVSPHQLRHTFAMSYLDAHPDDLVGLAAFLGHESLTTTAIYTRPRAEDLARKIEQMSVNADA